jgi:peptidoglycan/xylan/chitin deacetylase (PgdA/CDA1 family)
MMRRSLFMYALLSVAVLVLLGSTTSPARQQTVSVTWRLNQQQTGGRGGALALPGTAGGGAGSTTGTGAGSTTGANAPKPSRSSPTEFSHGDASDPNTPDVPTQEPTPPGPALPNSATALRNMGNAQVALTFDDGPDGATPALLDLLRAHHVKATFCVIGVNIKSNEQSLRQIVADGHTLCNHTWQHDLKLGTRSAEIVRSDLQRTSDEIHRVVPGAPIRYFRHPGGNFTPGAVAIARELGMTSIEWDVDPRDWDVRSYGSGGGMTNRIVNAVTRNTRPGSIILSHDGGGPRGATIAAYRTLVPWLLFRYELIALPV